MIVRRGVLVFAAAFVGLATISTLSWVFVYDDDELQVFRAVIERVHGSDGVTQYVVRAETEPCTPFGITAFHRRKLGVPIAVTTGYWMKNLLCRSLPGGLPLRHPYILTSQRELASAYASPSRGADTARLRQEIAKSYGVVGLSRVGFNAPHTRAVVYIELLYCGLCGGGQYYYLAKQSGAWRVVGVAGTWVS